MYAASFWSGGKGGVGKSTLAYNVAGDLSLRYPDASVVVYDVDPQGTIATLIAPQGQLPYNVITGVPKKGKVPTGTDFVIIDYPPGYQLVPKTKTVVMPIGPSFADTGSVVRTVQQMGKDRNIIVPINRAERHGVDTKEALEVLQTIGQENVPLIYKRAVYTKAVKFGMSVFQRRLFGTSTTGSARIDIRRLTDRIFNI